MRIVLYPIGSILPPPPTPPGGLAPEIVSDVVVTLPVIVQTTSFIALPPTPVPVPSMGGDVCFHNIFVISQASTLVVPAVSTPVVNPEGWRGFETDAFKVPLAAAQQKWESFEPAGTIVSIFPEGWRGIQLDANKIPPLNPAQQQWASWTAQPPYNTVLTAWAEFTPRFAKSFAASEQRFDSWPSLPPYNTVLTAWEELTPRFAPRFPVTEQRWDAWPFGLFNTALTAWVEQDYKFAKPFPIAEQKFDAYEPQGAVISVPFEGWRGYEVDLFKVAFPASQQRWDSFVPFPTTVAFPEGWRGLDDVVFSDLCVIYQQTSLVPFTPPTFNDYYSFELDYAFKSPVPAARQQWDCWPAEQVSATVAFPEGWRGLDDGVFSDYYVIYQQTSLVPFTPPVFNDFYSFELDYALKAPLPAAQQRWDAFEPQGTIGTVVFVEGWRGSHEYRFAKAFPPASEQKWDSWPATPPYNTVLTAWQEVTPRFTKPLAAAQQRFDSWPTIPPYNTVLTAWNEPPPRFAKPFPAALQQNIQAFEPRGTITSVFPEGWRGFEVDRFVTPFPVALQQWAPWPAQKIVIVATAFPEGWRGFETDIFAKPFPVAHQKWDAWPTVSSSIVPVPVMSGDVAFHSIFIISQASWFPQTKIFSTLPEGWRGFETDAFTKHYPPASEQQWSSFTPQGKIVSLLPDGWRGYEVDVFTKHYPPAHEQQWAAWLPEFVKFFTPDGWRGYEVDRFTKPFPAIEQQWASWPPQVVIFPAALVPGGGKRVLPKQFPQPPWDVEERKPPVWPIWDRVKWEEERRRNAQVPGTRAPVEPPPQEIFRGPPRIVTSAGLPSFREYTPPDAAGLARQMADARELGDAIAAVRALQAAQAQQQNTDEDDMADALRALAALGIKGGGG